jgi:glucokinase
MKILGVDIGGTNIRVGLVDENELTDAVSLKINRNGNVKEIINDFVSLIDHFKNEQIEGIGIGVPSVVNVERGIVYNVQNIPSWKEVHLKEILEDIYKLPVYVNNDANCFVVGEKYFGKIKGYKDAVGLIIGTGLGAGIIINNRLFAGNNCGAGEFGMIPFKDNIYEYYCSGQFFENKYNISGEECSMRAEKNDVEALKIFSEYSRNLGEAIKMIMYAIDPQIIVLGGSVSKSYKYFMNQMWKSIKNFAYSESLKKIKIEISERKHIAILGAAALYYDANADNL